MATKSRSTDSQEYRFLRDKIALRRAAGGEVESLLKQLADLCERTGWKWPKEVGHG